MEYPLLNTIKSKGNYLPEVYKWPFIEIDSIQSIGLRLYYNTRGDDEKNGFLFYFIEIVSISCVQETIENKWHPDHVDVHVLYQGVAYWDGIRHLYLGDEQTGNYGYIYYPNLDMQIKMLQLLQELEKKYCKQPGGV